jgi:transcriptional regulator, putative
VKLDLKRLRAERVACGLSQEDVAKKFGKTRSWYAKRENGFVSIGADELAKIAGIFNIDDKRIAIFFNNNVPKKEQE